MKYEIDCMNKTTAVLSLNNIHKSFGNDEVLKGVSFANRGDVLTILGRSGAGKSTLLRCVNFLEQPDAGEIRVNGTRLQISADNGRKHTADSKIVLELRRKIGMVFQSFNLWDHMTALENVIEAPVTVLGMTKSHAVEKARELLAKVGMSDREKLYPSQLSGGQQQRVAIARALAIEPQLLLFDEPTSALDPELVQEVLKVMGELAEEGRTMLIVTHEIAFARNVSTKVVFLDQGRIVEQGPPENVIDNPDSAQCRAFLNHQAAQSHPA